MISLARSAAYRGGDGCVIVAFTLCMDFYGGEDCWMMVHARCTALTLDTNGCVTAECHWVTDDVVRADGVEVGGAELEGVGEAADAGEGALAGQAAACWDVHLDDDVGEGREWAGDAAALAIGGGLVQEQHGRGGELAKVTELVQGGAKRLGVAQ